MCRSLMVVVSSIFLTTTQLGRQCILIAQDHYRTYHCNTVERIHYAAYLIQLTHLSTPSLLRATLRTLQPVRFLSTQNGEQTTCSKTTSNCEMWQYLLRKIYIAELLMLFVPKWWKPKPKRQAKLDSK